MSASLTETLVFASGKATELIAGFCELKVTWDIAETAESTEENPRYRDVVALCTDYEPAAYAWGSAMTPYFHTERELETYCQRVLRGGDPESDLAKDIARAVGDEWEATTDGIYA